MDPPSAAVSWLTQDCAWTPPASVPTTATDGSERSIRMRRLQ